jgi:drug/metabolite transporter (DMT)-like permease
VPGAATSPARATLLVLVAACCFGSISILVVLGRAEGAPLLALLFWRYLIGSAGLLVVSGGPARVRLPRERMVPLLVLGGLGQAIVTGTSLGSLEYIPAATLGFLFYTYPAWVTLIAAVRGIERLTALRALALVLSLAGIALMVGNPFTSRLPLVGIALALGSALAYAIYIPLINRLGAGLPASTTSTWLTLGTAIILGAIGLATGQLEMLTLTPRAWGIVGILAIVSTVLAFTVFLRGLAVLGPVRTAIISTIEPFWTALLGALVLSQPLSRGVVAGGACIAVAVALLQWKPRGAAAT